MTEFIIAPHAIWSEIVAFLLGGPLGIMDSMWSHPRLVRWAKRKNGVKSR